jgi:uncharacterized protein YdhG (YjbR/CyaY superfamily)
MKKAKHGKRNSVTKSSGARKSQKKRQETTAVNQTPAASKSALKRRAAKTKAAPKSKTAPLTIEEYFAAVPEPARSAMDQIRAAIRSVVPPETAEIISYKIPAFKHKKVLVWYAAFSNHCSLFPTAAVIESFKDELKDFSTSKGTIHFPLDKPMPVELIKKMVKERLGRSG